MSAGMQPLLFFGRKLIEGIPSFLGLVGAGSYVGLHVVELDNLATNPGPRTHVWVGVTSPYSPIVYIQ